MSGRQTFACNIEHSVHQMSSLCFMLTLSFDTKCSIKISGSGMDWILLSMTWSSWFNFIPDIPNQEMCYGLPETDPGPSLSRDADPMNNGRYHYSNRHCTIFTACITVKNITAYRRVNMHGLLALWNGRLASPKLIVEYHCTDLLSNLYTPEHHLPHFFKNALMSASVVAPSRKLWEG